MAEHMVHTHWFPSHPDFRGTHTSSVYSVCYFDKYNFTTALEITFDFNILRFLGSALGIRMQKGQPVACFTSLIARAAQAHGAP